MSMSGICAMKGKCDVKIGANCVRNSVSDLVSDYPGCQRLFLRGFRFRSNLYFVVRPSAEKLSRCAREKRLIPRVVSDRPAGLKGAKLCIPMRFSSFLVTAAEVDQW